METPVLLIFTLLIEVVLLAVHIMQQRTGTRSRGPRR
jgi:hypothetical protein